MSTAALAFTLPFAAAVSPRQALTVSEWADRHRVLSAKGSAERGQWRTSRTPYLREPMDCLSALSAVRRVVMMFAAQIGKTETGLNWLAYTMHHHPGPMLVVLPTLEVRKRWSLQRLAPMLAETPVLRELMSGYRSRDNANSEEIKDYPGGFLVLGGANSSASLRSMPIRSVLCDELDEFPSAVGTGLDPLDLVAQRTATFRRAKIALISTPTVAGASRIEAEWLASDMRQYQVPCPECGEFQVLVWENLRWDKDLTRCEYYCRHCGAAIQEHHKTALLAAGRWVAQHPERTPMGVRGYTLSALYAPLGLGQSWIDLAREWRDKHKDPARLKTFLNEKLAQPWEDRTSDIAYQGLADRATPWPRRAIPDGCLLLTAGVDVQDNRLAVQICGWGREETCYVLDWVEIPGDPARPELWDALTELLNAPLRNRFGHDLHIQASAIDTGGHYTHEVYAYVRARRVRRPMAIKGHSTPGRPVLASRPTPQDIQINGRMQRHGVALWMIGADTAKHVLYRRLHSDAATQAEAHMIRFAADLGDEYYLQLIAEVFDPARNRWVIRRGRRNEGLDTWCYAYAAAHHPELRVHAKRARDWDALQSALEPGATPPKSAPEPKPAPAPAANRRTDQPKRPDPFGSGAWDPL